MIGWTFQILIPLLLAAFLPDIRLVVEVHVFRPTDVNAFIVLSLAAGARPRHWLLAFSCSERRRFGRNA